MLNNLVINDINDDINMYEFLKLLDYKFQVRVFNNNTMNIIFISDLDSKTDFRYINERRRQHYDNTIVEVYIYNYWDKPTRTPEIKKVSVKRFNDVFNKALDFRRKYEVDLVLNYPAKEIEKIKGKINKIIKKGLGL